MTKTTTPTSPLDQIAAARRQQLDARNTLAAVELEARDAKLKLDQLARVPSHQATSPQHLLERERAEQAAVEVAKRLEATRASVAIIEAESAVSIREHFDAWLADHDRQMHELALKVDEGLGIAADAIGEMTKLFRESMSARSAAGYRVIQSEKLERNLATVVVNRLPLAPLRRLGSWSPSRKLGDKAADIWPAEGSNLPEHEQL